MNRTEPNKADRCVYLAMRAVDAGSDRNYADANDEDAVAELTTDVADVVAHLHHLADRHSIGWDAVLRLADGCYQGDVDEGGGRATRSDVVVDPATRRALRLADDPATRRARDDR